MKITDFSCNGKCSNCGSCCSAILPMTDKEIKRIIAYVKKHGIKERRLRIYNGADLTCPFRDNTNKKCLIYDVRPEICRTFLCCKSEEQIIRERNYIEGTRSTVFTRSVFFGNNEDFNFIKQLAMNCEGVE